MRKLRIQLVLGMVAALGTACSETNAGAEPGFETGPCLENACFDGLECLSNLCVGGDAEDGGSSSGASGDQGQGPTSNGDGNPTSNSGNDDGDSNPSSDDGGSTSGASDDGDTSGDSTTGADDGTTTSASTSSGDDSTTGGMSTCCEPHESPGCDDPIVESCVCMQDPYCCSTAWDTNCVFFTLFCGACQGGLTTG